MSETQTPEAYPTQEHDDENPQASSRAFCRSDYGRAARLIQAMRHVQGDIYTAKPEAQQDKVSELAVSLATAFALDSSDRFDAARFFSASALPVKPQASEPDEDDDYPNGDDGQTGL